MTEERPNQRRFRQQQLQQPGTNLDEPYGDLITETFEELSRFYFINPKGMGYHQGLVDFYEILHSIWDNATNIGGLPETNPMDRLHLNICKRLEDIFKDFSGTSILALSTSKLRSCTPYKPGGMTAGIFNELCNHYQTSRSNPHRLRSWSFNHSFIHSFIHISYG